MSIVSSRAPSRPARLALVASAVLAVAACGTDGATPLDSSRRIPGAGIAGSWAGANEQAGFSVTATVADTALPADTGATRTLARAVGTGTLIWRAVPHAGLRCVAERTSDTTARSDHELRLRCANADATTRIALRGPLSATDDAPALTLANVVDFAVAGDDRAQVPAGEDWLVELRRR